MSKKAPHRNILRVELDDQAKAALDKTRDSLGMTAVSILSRVVIHFAGLKHDAQRAIVDRPPSNGKAKSKK